MASRSPYQNVFFAYRGPSVAGTTGAKADQIVDRQLENNVTKALVNLLEYADPALTASFITKFLREPVRADSRRPFVYSLQGADPSGRRARRRFLIGVSMLAEVNPTHDAVPLQTGRVDAGVHRGNDLLVVFEVKVGASELDGQQLDRHARRWKIPNRGRRLVRWSAVYEWAENELGRQPDPVSDFLLRQFVELLDLTELAPFRGFRNDDFEFFRLPAADAKAVLKNRVAALGERVANLMSNAERERLGDMHVGQMGERTDHVWLDTQHGLGVANLTVELHSKDMQVNLVGWSTEQANRFERWLTSENTPQVLRVLGGRTLVIFERRAFNIDRRAAGAKPWWQKERSVLIASRPARQATSSWIAEALAQFDDRAWVKPAFHLRRSWPRRVVVAEGVSIADAVADEFRRLLPIVQQINEA